MGVGGVNAAMGDRSVAVHAAKDPGRISLAPEVESALAEARASLIELRSVWPASQRDRLVVWVRADEAGGNVVGARLRAAAEAVHVPNDVPILVELPGGRTVVVPWRAFSGQRAR